MDPAEVITDGALFVALALIVAGVALVSVPAAFITAGVLLAAGTIGYHALAPGGDR